MLSRWVFGWKNIEILNIIITNHFVALWLKMYIALRDFLSRVWCRCIIALKFLQVSNPNDLVLTDLINLRHLAVPLYLVFRGTSGSILAENLRWCVHRVLQMRLHDINCRYVGCLGDLLFLSLQRYSRRDFIPRMASRLWLLINWSSLPLSHSVFLDWIVSVCPTNSPPVACVLI